MLDRSDQSYTVKQKFGFLVKSMMLKLLIYTTEDIGVDTTVIGSRPKSFSFFSFLLIKT